MSKNEKKSGSIFVFAIVGVLVLAAFAVISVNTKEQIPEAVAAVEVPNSPSVSAEVQESSLVAETSESSSDLTTPRILGNPEAPVKISEHSSFTCGACSAFHSNNFKSLKAEYVDTGKAYIVFDDFPRNQVDIEVGSLARCISGDAYFNFIQLLFETQQAWANEGYKAHVKQNAMIAGLSDAKAEECLNNKTVHEALAANRQAAEKNFSINSTPHLVINDSKVIPGLSPYEEIKKAIEEELAKKSQ